MGLFDKNKNDPNKVALQNIVLNIDKKKLEVSEEFLEEMTKIYISKRMKLINDAVQSFPTLKKVSLLLAKYKYIDMLLDELEKIEPYHTFNPPSPSEYRKKLLETHSDYINNIITRAWKQLGYNNSQVPASEIEVAAFFGEYRDIYDEMPEDSQNLVNGLHEGVYGYGIFDDPPEKEPEEDEEDSDDEDADEEEDEYEEEE